MSIKGITHIGTLYAKPEHIEALIDSFEGLKQAKGYVSHVCYRDITDTNKVTLVEQWESKADHEHFVASFSEDMMKQWMNMISKKGDDSYYDKL